MLMRIRKIRTSGKKKNLAKKLVVKTLDELIFVLPLIIEFFDF